VSGEAVRELDHLIYAVPDLDAAVKHLGEALGVRPAAGGQHTGRGSPNMLLALGEGRYFEVIARDPGQSDPPRTRPFGLDELTAPRLVTWAVRAPGIEEAAADAAARGCDPGAVENGGRELPEGGRIVWRRTAGGDTEELGGVAPFFVEWGEETPHPSLDAPAGCRLVALRGEHPRTEEVERCLDVLQAELAVAFGEEPRLIATIEGPAGRLDLS
jgi:hypothetical protein